MLAAVGLLHEALASYRVRQARLHFRAGPGGGGGGGSGVYTNGGGLMAACVPMLGGGGGGGGAAADKAPLAARMAQR